MRLFAKAREYAHRGASALAESLGNNHPSTQLSLAFLKECTPYANAAASSSSSPSSSMYDRPYSPPVQ